MSLRAHTSAITVVLYCQVPVTPGRGEAVGSAQLRCAMTGFEPANFRSYIYCNYVGYIPAVPEIIENGHVESYTTCTSN